MEKEIVEQVYKRSRGSCEVCGSAGEELHHIVQGTGKRNKHETSESIVLLCRECHRGTRGVHGRNGAKLNKALKKQLQEKYFQQGYTEEEVREKMGGRLYG